MGIYRNDDDEGDDFDLPTLYFNDAGETSPTPFNAEPEPEPDVQRGPIAAFDPTPDDDVSGIAGRSSESPAERAGPGAMPSAGLNPDVSRVPVSRVSRSTPSMSREPNPLSARGPAVFSPIQGNPFPGAEALPGDVLSKLTSRMPSPSFVGQGERGRLQGHAGGLLAGGMGALDLMNYPDKADPTGLIASILKVLARR